MHQELETAFDLTGRVAVVTGASGGIGRQAAITFAQAGASIVIADVGEKGLAETVSRVEAVGAKVVSYCTDVSQRDQVDALAQGALDTFGRIDVWANVAGIIRYSTIVDMTETDLRAVLDVNLIGVYWGIAAAGRAMIAAGQGGSIINIASAGGDVPAPNISVYGMSKAGVMHLTKTAAVELGGHGIRVNGVAPGFIETPMVAPYFTDADGVVDPEARERILTTRASQSPLRATGVTTDITYAMLYLAADASQFMTGQIVRPNGGVFMA
jgi:3-oxoacyl-[acyl-carrier protein] reductase